MSCSNDTIGFPQPERSLPHLQVAPMETKLNDALASLQEAGEMWILPRLCGSPLRGEGKVKGQPLKIGVWGGCMSATLGNKLDG